jgi:hypothetical protein
MLRNSSAPRRSRPGLYFVAGHYEVRIPAQQVDQRAPKQSHQDEDTESTGAMVNGDGKQQHDLDAPQRRQQDGCRDDDTDEDRPTSSPPQGQPADDTSDHIEPHQHWVGLTVQDLVPGHHPDHSGEQDEYAVDGPISSRSPRRQRAQLGAHGLQLRAGLPRAPLSKG